MASTSSSSSVPNLSKYDVFLSFRGENTRHSFTDHLYKALLQAGIRTFRENDSIGRGQDLKPEIEKAIRESRASIIVLSTNYAKSRWCLDELVLIMDQRHQFNHFVLPVFYHVDPSHVRNQEQSFTIEVKGSKWTEVNVKRWKAALTEVANMNGLEVEGRLDIPAWFRSRSLTCEAHKLELLKHQESLELLSFHAFGSKIPIQGFKALAEELARYCEGNPLALKVLGSSLFVSAEDPVEKRNSMIKNWTSRMNSLPSFKGDLDSKIQDALQTSFDSLPLTSHKELFLHIACFFVGDYKEHVVTILEDDYHAKYGIMALINRCLLTVSANGYLVMHQLLQDMGRKIVCEESKDPAKRSRVWNSDESYSVLTERDVRPFSGVSLSHLFFTQSFKGSDTIEGLALDTRELKKGTKALAINADSLSKINKLKFLRLKNLQVTGSYENLPEVRWLWWHGSDLKTIPLGLCKNSLVALYMLRGKLENFEPPTVFNSLKILDLSFSSNLVSIRRFDRLPKLQALFLKYCSSLTKVCKTIGDLESLSRLDMKGCDELQKAPSTKKLQVLDLSFCSNLKSISCLPSTLEELYTNWCFLLEKITFQSARFTLQMFRCKGCELLCEIQGLFKLVPIAELDEADFRHMKWIKAYEDHKVDLVGDDITETHRIFWNLQMLYEYGIRSTFLTDIYDQRMTASEYTSTSPSFLSFHVPICPDKRRIHGLNVTVLYRSLCEYGDEYGWGLLLRISNKTKGLSWIYNPVLFGKPRVDEDVVWLSYWPIGYILDAGDEVYVEIWWEGSAVISGCGASLVYMDEGEEVEKMESNEEVIGGDLSEFEVKKGCYYLCRRDYFKSRTSVVLKKIFNDTTIEYPGMFRSSLNELSVT